MRRSVVAGRGSPAASSMPADATHAAFGRFGETAMWILVALTSGPLRATKLLDEVRNLDGHVGPGALFGAVARLERRGLIEAVVNDDGRPAYRLSRRWPEDRSVHSEGVLR